MVVKSFSCEQRLEARGEGGEAGAGHRRGAEEGAAVQALPAARSSGVSAMLGP